MEQFISISHSIWTVVAMVLFIGIVIWAWSGSRKEDFEQAARLPFEEDELPVQAKEKNHG